MAQHIIDITLHARPQLRPIHMRVLHVLVRAIFQVAQVIGKDVDDGLVGRQRGDLVGDLGCGGRMGSEVQFEPFSLDPAFVLGCLEDAVFHGFGPGGFDGPLAVIIEHCGDFGGAAYVFVCGEAVFAKDWG
jgi:hypothetical protein